MLELKFFKQLPCRSLNNNKSYVELAGADLYNDKDGNRYAFLSFKNNYRGPFFSLYLYLKEYDSSGTFLKENRFTVPNFYGKTGLHVINEPIEVEKECEGIEVFIYLAEYVGKNFYNDKFVTPGREKLEINMAAMKNQAKASANSQTRPMAGANLGEEEEFDENGNPLPTGPASPAQMAATANATVQPVKSLFNFIPLAVGILAVIVGVVFSAVILSNFIYFINNGGFLPVDGGNSGGGGGGGGGDDWDWRIKLLKLFFQSILNK